MRTLILLAMTVIACTAEPRALMPRPAQLSGIGLRPVNLMPWPAQLTWGDGRLAIDQSFRVALTGYREARLERAALRLIDRLARQTGMPLDAVLFEDSAQATLAIECEQTGEEESYTLEVTPGRARLRAVSPPGVLRGMETFLQLVDLDGEGFAAPAARIEDRPRFPWRGLLIDSSRHFLPVEVIERNLDGMAALKLNVLHWHLTDDQGFRLEMKHYPKLHELGSDGQYYTQEQVRRIVEYAADRGIRVMPEIEMPGHSTSWFAGHPELAAAPGPYSIERTWGIKDPCMDPTREELYPVLDAVLGEVAALFPDEYIHIGGDEVNGKQWAANSAIQQFMRERGMKDAHDLQAYFNQRVQAILKKHGKKMAGWDEVLHPDLPKDILVQSWRGQKSLAAAARQGYAGILSNGYYLDLMQPAKSHYAVDPMDGDAATLEAEEKARVLGGEACMWAEYVSAETVDSRIWPRAAAVAERLWSPPEVRDPDSMYGRLDRISRRLDWLGLTHRSGYRLMLERLAGDDSIEELQRFADILEPVKGYARGSARRYTQQTPLNRLVDAARPESDVAHEFGRLVEAGEREKVRRWLALWRGTEEELLPVLERSFLLRETIPLARDVTALAKAGLEALDYMERNERAPEGWTAATRALLTGARRPRAELLIMIVPGVEKLLNAAASGGKP